MGLEKDTKQKKSWIGQINNILKQENLTITTNAQIAREMRKEEKKSMLIVIDKGCAE